MENKKCFKCNESKSLDEFYKHKDMFDGHLGKCKTCTKNDTKLRTDILCQNEEWLEVERTRHRDKYYRLEYKDKHKPSSEKKKEIMKKYYDKYPEKVGANTATSKLIRNENCELHHWSYNSEHFTDIIELNYKIHAMVHRFIKYDQEFKMYKDKLGNLLDTKEKHLKYINYIIDVNK